MTPMENESQTTPTAIVDQLLTEIGTDGRRIRVPGFGELVQHGRRIRVPGFGVLVLRGRLWWIRYSHHGRRREESSKGDDVRVALKLLRRRVEECVKGRRLDPAAEERVRMSELFDALVLDYENNQRRSLETLKNFRLVPLRGLR